LPQALPINEAVQIPQNLLGFLKKISTDNCANLLARFAHSPILTFVFTLKNFKGLLFDACASTSLECCSIFKVQFADGLRAIFSARFDDNFCIISNPSVNVNRFCKKTLQSNLDNARYAFWPCFSDKL